jgi:hypothetical protein
MARLSTRTARSKRRAVLVPSLFAESEFNLRLGRILDDGSLGRRRLEPARSVGRMGWVQRDSVQASAIESSYKHPGEGDSQVASPPAYTRMNSRPWTPRKRHALPDESPSQARQLVVWVVRRDLEVFARTPGSHRVPRKSAAARSARNAAQAGASTASVSSGTWRSVAPTLESERRF